MFLQFQSTFLIIFFYKCPFESVENYIRYSSGELLWGVQISKKLKRKGFWGVLAHINRANVHRERTNSPTRGESRRKSLYLITFFRLFFIFRSAVIGLCGRRFPSRVLCVGFFFFIAAFFRPVFVWGMGNGGNHPFGKTSDFIYNQEAKRKREMWR